jgi:hypothetical protein
VVLCLTRVAWYVWKMIVVYEHRSEMMSDIEKERKARADFQILNYYHSGLAPPTNDVVRRRFCELRRHQLYPVRRSLCLPR